MNLVRVRSRKNSQLLQQDEIAQSFKLTLQSGHLSAARDDRDNLDLRWLAEYFVDLADNALVSWSGTKDWESLKGEMRLSARSFKGHVVLTVRLRQVRADPEVTGGPRPVCGRSGRLVGPWLRAGPLEVTVRNLV